MSEPETPAVASDEVIAARVVAAVVPRSDLDPPAPFATWCAWAQDGLRKALDGMKNAGGGVTEYHVGSRGLRREGSKSQIDNVGYWNEMVKQFCGVEMLPSSLTGRDTACRIIPRDV